MTSLVLAWKEYTLLPTHISNWFFGRFSTSYVNEALEMSMELEGDKREGRRGRRRRGRGGWGGGEEGGRMGRRRGRGEEGGERGRREREEKREGSKYILGIFAIHIVTLKAGKKCAFQKRVVLVHEHVHVRTSLNCTAVIRLMRVHQNPQPHRFEYIRL